MKVILLALILAGCANSTFDWQKFGQGLQGHPDAAPAVAPAAMPGMPPAPLHCRTFNAGGRNTRTTCW